MCLFVFDEMCCPKFKLQEEKEKFLEKTLSIIAGYQFSLKREHRDIRASEAEVININILQGKNTVNVKS